MNHESKKYLWTDAEILWAVVSSKGTEGVNKEDILSCVDSVQHMILTDEELHGGVSRLKSGGFISENGGRYNLTAYFIDNKPKSIKGKPSAEYKYCYKILGLKVS